MGLVVSGRLLLAAVFASAAVLKLRSRAEFTRSLQVPFRRGAPYAAITVICMEVVIAAALLAFPMGPIALTASGLFVFSASCFLALRLILVDETDCNCWGTREQRPGEAEPIGWESRRYNVLKSAFQPAWFGLRNGALTASAWLLTQATWTGTAELPRLLLVFGMCPALIAASLAASIGLRRRLLGRDDHPLKGHYAPRLAPLVALSWYSHQPTIGEWVVDVRGAERSHRAVVPAGSPAARL